MRGQAEGSDCFGIAGLLITRRPLASKQATSVYSLATPLLASHTTTTKQTSAASNATCTTFLSSIVSERLSWGTVLSHPITIQIIPPRLPEKAEPRPKLLHSPFRALLGRARRAANA
jgi:hypothetical protein